MTEVGTYWRTLRHLKVRQIVGRVIFLLGSRAPSERPAPLLRARTGPWVPSARRSQSLIDARTFRFLNRQRALGDGGWDPPAEEKLWRYNLHYFDDLNSESADQRREWHIALIYDWIAQNESVKGIGWEPYPTSLRIANWVKWFLAGDVPEPAFIHCLARQVRWLMRRIEWHLLGNHLSVNAKALLMAGLFFQGKEADRWRSRGISILRKELDEQVLGDGGQFERTPMYHLLAFEDVLDLIACIQCLGAPDYQTADLHGKLTECAVRMWGWAEVMRFRDGTLPRFNDCAEGVSPPYSELVRVALALNVAPPRVTRVPVQLLAESGYVRMCWNGATTAFLDVAQVGPDYLPGHAHADTLSFELEINGRQVVVNRGTSCYGLSPRRHYERSTAAHSTVEVMSQSSSEMWSGFRVGRRARPLNLLVTDDVVICSHDGYYFLPGHPCHRRTWKKLQNGLLVDDELGGEIEAVARYHLSPGLSAHEVIPGTWAIFCSGVEVARVEFRAAWVRTVDGFQAVAFGKLESALTLEAGLDEGRASAHWYW